MSTTLVIATREIRERSRFLIAAAAAAFVPFLAALVPAVGGNRGMAIVTIAGFLAVGFSCGLALAQGVSTIAGDLAEKRMSFYFAKPISPAALWAGKSIAAMLICFAALAIILLPAMIFAPAQFADTWKIGGLRIALAAAIGCVVLFLVSHVLSTMMRSRSLLVVLDFLLVIATIGAAALIVRPLYVAGGARIAAGILEVIALTAIVILAIAPVRQLEGGRTDGKRNHAELSKTLWPLVAIVLVMAGGYVLWLVSVKPADLVEIYDVSQSPAGDHAFLTGQAANRFDLYSSFMIDTANGTYARLESPPWGGVTWSRDGRIAAWMQPVSYFPMVKELELFMREAESDRSVATGIRVKGYYGALALSDDGARVAIDGAGIVSIYDLRDRRLLASAKRSARGQTRLFFATPDLVRIVNVVNMGKSANLTLSEFDIRRRALTETGRRALSYSPRLSFSKDGSRLFLQNTGEIDDGRTGATIAMVGTDSFGSVMLSDGTVVAVQREATAMRVRLLNRDGVPQHDIALRGIKRAFVSAEIADGKVVLSASPLAQSGKFDSYTTFVIDRARGVVERSVPKVRGDYVQLAEDPRVTPREAGKPLVVYDEKGRPMLLDLRSGTLKKL